MSTTFYRLPPEGSAAGFKPSDMTPPEAFTTDDKTELIDVFYQNDDGLTSGLWECAPTYEEYDAYPVHEMVTVISGVVKMTDAAGKVETFTAGDTFFIPKGTKLTWEITEYLRKFFLYTE